MTSRTSALPEFRTHWSELAGSVHWIDLPGPGDPTPVVAVHGLGASHAGWLTLAPLLAKSRHVYALDLHGHGRTPTAGRDTRVQANQRLLHRFLSDVVRRPAILVGNSMGALISLHQAAAHPQTVAALALLGPALPLGGHRWPEPAVAAGVVAAGIPGLGAQILRRRRRSVSPRAQIDEMLHLAGVPVERVPPAVLDLEVAMVAQRRQCPDLESAMERAARSTVRTVLERGSYDAVLARVTQPVLVVHGHKDRLVPVESAWRAGRMHPEWTIITRRDMGHAPMLEHPEWTAGVINSWLESLDV